MKIVLEDLSARFQNSKTFAEVVTTALAAADLDLQPLRGAGEAQGHCGDTRRRFERFMLFRHSRNYTPFGERFRFFFKCSDAAPREELSGARPRTKHPDD